MNNNKQQTKGNTMRKIAISIVGALMIMATSANACGWGGCGSNSIWTKPNYSGGYNFYSGNSFLGYSKPTYGGGSIFYYK
tara:strand:+ start:191 stop:430 length:240 start_codon:yes stop_codon:yes gene_type:complete